MDQEDLAKISVAKERIISLLIAEEKELLLEDINNILGGDMYHTQPAVRSLEKAGKIVRRTLYKETNVRGRGQFLGYVYSLAPVA